MSSDSAPQPRIDSTPADQRTAHPLSEQVRAYVNQLTPPIGTSFFDKQSVTIFDNKQLMYLEPSPEPLVIETLTWRADIYTYVTGASPNNPDFAANDGEVFIIMVHGGTGQTGEVTGLDYSYTFKMTTESAIDPIKQFPAPGSGTQTDDKWNYSISFDQIMSMFNNNGNTPFNFDAKYSEDFTVTGGQVISKEVTKGLQFAVDFDEWPDHYVDFPVIGLSVFRVTDLKAFPMTFTFEASVLSSLGYDNIYAQGTNTFELTLPTT